MEKMQISVEVNGDVRVIDVESNDVLLDVIRDKFGLKSPKSGCERGDCGACTILLDGHAVRSCLMLAVEADGHKIMTLEGLSQDGLTPLQQSFIKHNSFQCGYCAPGMILSAVELLQKNPKPSREEIQEAISGNLCRCTGYERIIEAIQNVAQDMA